MDEVNQVEVNRLDESSHVDEATLVDEVNRLDDSSPVDEATLVDEVNRLDEARVDEVNRLDEARVEETNCMDDGWTKVATQTCILVLTGIAVCLVFYYIH